MLKNHSKKVIYLFVYLTFTLLVLSTSHFPFFWDTVQLASKHAHYFYETNFSSIILPNEIDSGHLPGLGIYLALVWKVFGKTLVVSHLAMLPFVLGIVYQSIQLTKRLFPERWAIAALILLLADATLLAQCTLVSPDVLVLFFFLMALNGFTGDLRKWYALALAGLVVSSMRGMMCVAGLFFADAVNKLIVFRSSEHKFLSLSLVPKPFSRLMSIAVAYVPAIVIAGSFLAWHYYKTGWIGYHKNMPWYPLFELVGPAGMVKNAFILGWRLVDMGRLFIWITGGICLWHYYRNRPALDKAFTSLLVVFICLLLSLSHAVIMHKSLAAHRYLLPIYITFALLVSYYLFNYLTNNFLKRVLFGITILGMLSGNFWIYADHISKGWDSTLAYVPYFSLRDKMIVYMQKEKIPIEKTGSPFPNHGLFEYIDLSGKNISFALPDLDKNQYIFYSNVYNAFSDKELYQLETSWKKVQEYRFLQVRVTLYKRP